jgi:hypothetical protein
MYGVHDCKVQCHFSLMSRMVQLKFVYNEHDAPTGCPHDWLQHRMAHTWDSKYLMKRLTAALGEMKVVRPCHLQEFRIHASLVGPIACSVVIVFFAL